MLDIFLTAAYIASQKIAGPSVAKMTNQPTPQVIEFSAKPDASNNSHDSNSKDNNLKTPDLLSQINSDLAKQKVQDDPFANKKIKIDLESLGLDDVSNKQDSTVKNQAPNNDLTVGDLPKIDSKPKDTNNSTNTNNSNGILPPVAPKLDIPPTLDTASPPTQSDTSTNNKDTSINSLIKLPEFFKKKEDTANNKTDSASSSLPTTTPSTTAPSQEIQKVSPAPTTTKATPIKNNVTKRSVFKKQNPKFIPINRQKLEQLKKEYLLKDNEQNEKELIEENKKIIPRKKEIINFSTLEVPPPLLARHYSQDNFHNPIILNREDKINLIFKAINKRNPAYFDSAYEELKEPNLKNIFGDTILTYATLMQRHDIMAIILSKGADPDLTNDLDYTALNIAIELNDYNAVQLLLEAGAKITHTDQSGRTYLMQSVITGFLPIIDLLITNNIDIDALDNKGNSALAIAKANNKNIVVNFLIKKGAK